MKTQKFNLSDAAGIKISGVAASNMRNNRDSETGSLLKRLKWFSPFAFCAVLFSCTNNDQLVQQYKQLHERDSALMIKTQADDSTIRGYVSNLNEIQTNLDEIKSREKILSVQSSGETGNKNTALADIKALDNLILKSNKEIADLNVRLKKMNVKDAGLQKMVASMTAQLSEKDSEIAVIQSNLSKVSASYAQVTQQFNDSITVLQAKSSRIEDMTNKMNTVYYAVGTVKELKDNRVIAKTGGFIGIGKNTELTPDQNTSYFTKTDLTKLSVIPLNAKFKKLLTVHPSESYKITGDKTADSLVITDQSSFWSENKYLVVAVR
ncbi:MAG TPA: hypothetical protein VK808_05770 [Bacteroidia bacterium]|nr:hypothetical protein [Bacteroidia bacterium]